MFGVVELRGILGFLRGFCWRFRYKKSHKQWREVYLNAALVAKYCVCCYAGYWVKSSDRECRDCGELALVGRDVFVDGVVKPLCSDEVKQKRRKSLGRSI